MHTLPRNPFISCRVAFSAPDTSSYNTTTAAVPSTFSPCKRTAKQPSFLRVYLYTRDESQRERGPETMRGREVNSPTSPFQQRHPRLCVCMRTTSSQGFLSDVFVCQRHAPRPGAGRGRVSSILRSSRCTPNVYHNCHKSTQTSAKPKGTAEYDFSSPLWLTCHHCFVRGWGYTCMGVEVIFTPPLTPFLLSRKYTQRA